MIRLLSKLLAAAGIKDVPFAKRKSKAIDFAPLANAKTIPIDRAGADSNRPFRRRLYATSRHFDSSCCVSQNLCLLNYPRDAIAPRSHQHRGAIVETISLRTLADRWARSASLPSTRPDGVKPVSSSWMRTRLNEQRPEQRRLARPRPNTCPRSKSSESSMAVRLHVSRSKNHDQSRCGRTDDC
jgi:hypothetical protein